MQGLQFPHLALTSIRSVVRRCLREVRQPSSAQKYPSFLGASQASLRSLGWVSNYVGVCFQSDRLQLSTSFSHEPNNWVGNTVYLDAPTLLPQS